MEWESNPKRIPAGLGRPRGRLSSCVDKPPATRSACFNWTPAGLAAHYRQAWPSSPVRRLTVEGLQVGALCVGDSHVRNLDWRQVDALVSAARQVSSALEHRLLAQSRDIDRDQLRLAIDEANEKEMLLRHLAELVPKTDSCIAVACMTLDVRGRIMEWNAMSERLYGPQAAEVLFQKGDQRLHSGRDIRARHRSASLDRSRTADTIRPRSGSRFARMARESGCCPRAFRFMGQTANWWESSART